MKEDQHISLYKSEDGSVSFDVNIDEESVWLTQKQIAELFEKDAKTISRHIINLFKEGTLEKETTVSNFEIVQKEGYREVIRKVDHYNLDVIISIGYRVKSQKGFHFKQWAEACNHKSLKSSRKTK